MATDNKQTKTFFEKQEDDNVSTLSTLSKESCQDLSSDKLLVDFVDYLFRSERIKTDIANYINKELFSVYSDPNFRHSYYVISDTIQKRCGVDEHGDFEAAWAYFGTNLDRLKELIDEQEFKSIKKPLAKFYDHCRLEISRFTYFNKIFWHSNQEQMEQDNRRVESEKLYKVIQGLYNEVSQSRSEYITILGIFAALICASVGGLHIFDDVMKSLAAVSVYRIVFMLALTSIGVFNTFCVLIYLIAKLVGKGELIKTSDKYIVRFNRLMLLIMLADFAIWYLVRHDYIVL